MNKLKKRITGIALKILQYYFEGSDYSIFLFDRNKKEIHPFLWFPRYLPQKDDQPTKSVTNDWTSFKDLLSYDGALVFDVGAAVGDTSRLFSKNAKRVYAFEPNQENFNNLTDIIYLNRIGNVEPYNLAVSNQNSDLTFYNRESHGIHSLGKHPKGKIINTSKIKAVKLDDFYQDNFYDNEKIGLLKIDTEGFELEVLQGSENLLKNKTIRCVIFEHSHSLLKTLGKNPNSIFKLLEGFDYEIYDYKGNLFDYRKNNPNKISDFLARAKQVS